WSHPLAPRELADALVGRRIERLGRRGKYLLWSFEHDVHLAQHLRMTGGVLWRPSAKHGEADPPFTRVRLELGPAPRRSHPAGPAVRQARRQSAPLRRGVIEPRGPGPDARGATIDDFRDIDGASGAFQIQSLVHRREGEPCPRCGSPISKMVVGGRASYVC